jgi:predicted DNA-binding transcriptional regulator AlpA
MSSVLYKDYFTPEEAADYCCISRAWFDEVVRHAVPAIPLGGRKIVFRRADLQRWIEKHGDDRVADGQTRPVRLSKLVRQ